MDNNQVSDNNVGYTPNSDAIQEFNLISQNASAEFGNFMGGIISTSIKAAATRSTAIVFEFFRNDKLNANQWQNNLLGRTAAGNPVAPRQIVRWNQFGGTLGGPIKKDKLFFFVDYQGARLDTPSGRRLHSPDASRAHRQLLATAGAEHPDQEPADWALRIRTT